MLSSVLMSGCGRNSPPKQKDIIIFHAGSLSVPFKKVAQKYEEKNPGKKVLLEPAGSLVCARKITELKKPCDIIASADYFVIDKLILPEYSSWNIRFATNEIVIAYQEKSKYANEIDSLNWPEILLRKDVIYSRSDPDSDPCGYRSLFTFSLAEKYYRKPGLAEKLANKNREFIRPKEVDLVALIETNAADYMFQYKSVAIQHNLRYIELPDYINLGNPDFEQIYKSVSTEVTGSSPGSRMTIEGDYINYSLTILKDAPNSEDAIGFVHFLLSSEGRDILRNSGQKPLIPVTGDGLGNIPEKLKVYLNE
jgi:molybdate/tungstate transport system substrate-binding protein